MRPHDILLTTINAKWIHPSLALRLLKANLGTMEETCEIIEFNLRQPLDEMLEALLAVCPRILGISVSIWNHGVTVQLLEELEKIWAAKGKNYAKPVVVLGGPEVSHLPEEADIFKYTDYVIRGEGEIAFRELCEKILIDGQPLALKPQFIIGELVNLDQIKNAYHLYNEEDVTKKLIYVEASRGCVFNCEFCLSSVKDSANGKNAVREFPLEPFLTDMSDLVRRGVKTFKFLDRTFNINIKRAVCICEFFLEKIEERKEPLTVHFEMVPSLFPRELLEMLTRFPPDTLRLEIGIQTLNAETASRIGRHSDPEKELDTIRFLREKTNAIIHADLIAGLPGEDLESFGNGFDRLWLALFGSNNDLTLTQKPQNEIQLGILKLLPGASISRHNEEFKMRYNPAPPYEIEETSAISADDIKRIKNFARFWEIIVNRGLIKFNEREAVFDKFMALSDSLFYRFGRNWGIDKNELMKAVRELTTNKQVAENSNARQERKAPKKTD